MFSKLKEKLQNWTKKLAKDEEETTEKISEREKEKIKETAKKGEKKKEEKTISERIEEAQPKKIDENIFNKISSKIQKVKITEEQFEIYGEELEMLLLENNVAVEVAEKIVKELKEQIVGKELLKKEVEEEIKDVFKDIMRKILVEPLDIREKINKKYDEKKEPYVMLFCGINGTGKTTTVAKIADYLQRNEIPCVLAAGDTFRAASIEQIKNHGEKLNIKVIAHDYGSDPASVGFDAVQYAKKHGIKCVLIDTAGRIHTSKDLLKEIEKISKVTKPDLKVFVGESITRNDAIEQAKSFNWAIGIDAIVLTKADIDDKGGTSLSVGYVTKKPILFLGTGQLYDNIEPFDKEKFIEKLGL
jgi:fused signal recognition particle receptor